MRKMIQKILDSIRYLLGGSKDRAYPDTYLEELEYQCERLTPLGCVACTVIWLPYLIVDYANFPSQIYMPIIRLGLSVVAIGGLVTIWLKPGRFWGLAIVMVHCVYFLFGASLVAILSSAEPAYVGGLILCLVMTSLLIPVPIGWLLLLLTCTYVFFFLGIRLSGIGFNSNPQLYSFQDLGSTIFITYSMAIVQHRIRKSNYQRAKEIERQKTESNRLLLNILPEAIAEELKANGAAKPIRIEQATVMFTDFVGFTRISEKLSPEEVVDELDKCFSYFDQVTEKYTLEKLKTIGDSFMCAGGLPKPNNTHAIDCCLAALEVQAFMNQMKEIKHSQGFDYWELRLGVNTGPLVAGVVGHKKFAYDVWGDTVNTASRLESSGVAGKINISASTYKLVKSLFACSQRGHVSAKNKGKIRMYFLEGIRPELSVNKAGRVPNEKFKKSYDALREAS